MDAIKAFISPPGTRGGAHKQLQESTGALACPGSARTERAGRARGVAMPRGVR